MFTPEEQQIEICSLKFNLETIIEDLDVQNALLSTLEAENEQKYHETMAKLQIARSLNAEKEQLNQENVRLTAKHMQIKQQCNDVIISLEKARQYRSELEDQLKQVEQDAELQIRKYENSLREKADRFRRTRNYYDEEETQKEIDKVTNTVSELQEEQGNLQAAVEQLKCQLEALQPAVPENILEILGKPELEKSVESLSKNHKELCVQRKCLDSNDNI